MLTVGTAVAWLLAAGVPLTLLGLSLAWRRWLSVPVWLREIGIGSSVFCVWQIPTRLSAGDLDAAVDRALWIHQWEQGIGLPDEAAWQQAVLPHSLLVQAANGYYIVMHFGAMAALLVWLFRRHRTAYARVRTQIVLVTVVSLVVQTVAVAPPRLVPQLEFTDTAEHYGQSVYGSGPGGAVAGELTAVPSVHVAWSLLVAMAVIRVSRHRARWLMAAHPPATLAVVVVTANHFWFDALAAVAVVTLCTTAHRALGACRRTPAPAVAPAATDTKADSPSVEPPTPEGHP